MLRDRFYALIDAAREDGAPTAPSADLEALQEVLAALVNDELRDFVRAYDDELLRLNRWEVWAVGCVAEGGMSDDGFHYFRSWLIGKGMSAVDAVLADPDSLADHLDDGEHENENEELEYVGSDLLEERGLEDPRGVDGAPHADDDPAGEPFDEDTVDAQYPRTAAAAG